ncbi:MAG TPA: ubiquitin-like small modifier protein 1 [Longimicrobiales bacterium]
MAKVMIPAALRDYTGGQRDIAVAAATVAQVLDDLARQHPRLRRHLYSEHGSLRSYVNVFVNQDEIRSLDGLDTEVGEADTLYIVPSIAGG